MDWDDAYQNGKYISGGDEYLGMWKVTSATYRESLPESRREIGLAYGAHKREVYDLFLPEGLPKGVLIFIHGGYWQSLDQSLWSHLAAGPMAHGWAVAMPGYPLCPEVSMADITKSIVRAVGSIGEKIAGEIIICGHSAGGHLTARMACTDIALPHAARVRQYVGLSGVYDLRPLMRTGLNEALRLNMACAASESPALKTPRKDVRLLAWVGENERPEFLRQTALLGNIWRGAFANTRCVHAKGHHHFSVIGDLAKAQSPLTKALVG